MEKIHTNNAPAAVGPYSQAMVVNGLVYTSGQIALDPATGDLVGTTIEEQAEQVMPVILNFSFISRLFLLYSPYFISFCRTATSSSTLS